MFSAALFYTLAEGVGVVVTAAKRFKGDLRGPIGGLQYYN